MRECFQSLDDDESGSIGIEELEGPLIGLGFYETRDECVAMIQSVDQDQSGQIEFKEFLQLIRSADNSENEKTALINQFFKDLTNGTLGSADLRFPVIYADIRRKAMYNSFIGTGDEKIEGNRILQNVYGSIQEAKQR